MQARGMSSPILQSFATRILKLYRFPVMIFVFSPSLKVIKGVNANRLLAEARKRNQKKSLLQQLWSGSVTYELLHSYQLFLRDSLKSLQHQKRTATK